MCFALMFSYGTELPCYIGFMERHILLLTAKAQGIASARVLWLSPPWSACPGLPAALFAGNVGWGDSCPRLWLTLLTDPWVLEVRKDKKSFFLVNANYVFKRDVLILKGGRASLSALQFLSLRDSSLEPVASCCSSIHPESTEQILQKGLEAWGLPVLWGRGSCGRSDFHVFPHFSLLSHFKIKGCFY